MGRSAVILAIPAPIDRGRGRKLVGEANRMADHAL